MKLTRNSLTVTQGLPSHPGPINDNTYLAAASQAAIADVSSGAYDEFLFEDDSLVQMPFESSVDSYTALQVSRMKQQQKREEAQYKAKCDDRSNDLNDARRRLADRNMKLKEIDAKLQDERDFLEGVISGQHGLDWASPLPEVTSSTALRIRLFVPVVLYIFVAVADVAILRLSLENLFSHDGRAVMYFIAPAIGIQVGFPHVVGDRLALVLRGTTKKINNLVQIFIVGGVWLGFCYAVANIRMEFVKVNNPDLDGTVLFVIFLMTFLMVVGLGSLLIFLGIHANPHLKRYMRISLQRMKQIKLVTKAQSRVTFAETEVQKALDQLAIVEDVFSVEISSVLPDLAEAAKAVYRRALVNQTGSTDFTSSYWKVKQGETQTSGAIES